MATAIFPAAGHGKRMMAGINKVFMNLAGTPILIHTLKSFSKCSEIDNLVIVASGDDISFIKTILDKVSGLKPYKIVLGGSERQYSVRNGLAAVEPDTDIVLVHDAARPLVSEDIVLRTIAAAKEFGGAVAGVQAKNTIKICDENGFVKYTPDRNTLWEIQTPQAFKLDILVEAHELASRDDFLGTDEASIVERSGHPVKIVEGDYSNIKITTPEDVILAEEFLRERFTSKAAGIVSGVLDSVSEELRNRFVKK